MKRTNKEAPKPTNQLLKMKVRLMRLNSTICPAVIATNNRIAKENGFVNRPMNSTNIIMGLIAIGTP